MAQSDSLEYCCTLKPETLEIAKVELNENPCTRMLEVKAFRDRVKNYPGLRANLDPKFLLRFLRVRKFDQERAFDLIVHYYTNRKEDREVFDDLKPSTLTLVYRSNLSFPHPHRDRDGRLVYFFYPGRIDTSHYSNTDVCKAEYLNLAKLMEDEETQVRGVTILADYTGFTMSHLMGLDMAYGKRIVKIWQDAFPVRFKKCLVVNEPHYIEMALNFFTVFLKDKLLKRIHCLGTDWQKLHEHIDPACLPRRYGGTMAQEPSGEAWVERMLQCDREMEDDLKFGFVDYTLGRGQSQWQQDATDHLAGTYKKLDV